MGFLPISPPPLPVQGLIPIACAKFTIARAAEDPLLKVPPARRGNQDPSVPLAKRGEPKGGGQIVNFGRAIGSTSLGFTVDEGYALFVALTPSPSPTEWERGAALPPSPACGRGGKLIRVHRLSSLCARRARFFALTPSPSPTAWERGAALPPSPACGRGGQGG
jgi:hypothetical protein